MAPAEVVPWPHVEAPTEAALERLMRDEGLKPHWWSNGPGDRYAAHAHSYHKVLYCARGSIRFDLGSEQIEVTAGDRLEIPPNTLHSALVGPAGVTCVEAPRT